MSRFLFSTLGSLGDLHPYIAVARALISQGHEAVIATAEDYRDVIEGAGVEFAPVRPGMTELGDYQTLVRKTFDVIRGPEYLIRHIVMPHLRSAYECLMEASKGADVLVSHPLAMALPLVGEKQGIPRVATVLSPMSFMSPYDSPVFGFAPWLQKLSVFGPGPYRCLFMLLRYVVNKWEIPLQKLRKDLGLPPSPYPAMFEGQFSPLLNLALFDPQLAQPQVDWPDNTRICGCPIFDGKQADNDVLADLEQFLAEGEAPIVFALGSSAVWIAGDFWDNAIAATKALGRRAILLTGPTMPTSLPDTIRAYPYLPYSKVFPHAAAVVHQAGIGTLAQAMRAGRPQLIVPVAFDQADNAHRTQALGLARTIPFQKTTARRLTAELSLLLDSGNYSNAARSMAASLTEINGATCAARELIAFAQRYSSSHY
jgi:UDP:flavonoid glycosyltransferase YjiC (YdhE family)